MGLGSGGPDARSCLAGSLTEQSVRLGGEFFSPTVMLRSGHCCSTCLVVLALRVMQRTLPVKLSYRGMPATAAEPGTGFARASMTG
jgi:hypothetical protein